MARLLTAFLLIVGTWAAYAQQSSTIYGCVDASGRRYYTNVKSDAEGKKCTIVQREVSVVPAQPAPAPKASAPAPGAAKVPQNTQKSRDEARRRILEEELQAADKQLAAAKQKLAEQEAVREGGERNYQRVLDRLKPYKAEVERQEQNVTQLKRELSNLR
ncbi:MAG: DUF4124 domain-containing protein [Betaproteobacteria bacterium]|nr:DUF4124 domain-containing protein [Betaproteobacteria bacterium]MBI2959026.1 DUF4124 domain-containing protein [Betaproteobacteria bacterium]